MIETIIRYLKIILTTLINIFKFISNVFIKLLDYPLFLGVLSFFIPGLGQVFAKVPLRGGILFLISIIFTLIYTHYDLGIILSIVYILFKLFAAYDAIKFGFMNNSRH